MNNEFSMYLNKIFKGMEEERYNLSHPFVGSEHLLLSLLKHDKESILLFSDFDVTYDNFLENLVTLVGKCKKNVDFNLYTPLLKRVINYAEEEALIEKEKVSTKHLIVSLLEENEGVAIRILVKMGVDIDELYKVVSRKKVILDNKVSFGKNLNESVNMEEKVVGREKEISYIIETLLRKNKNNPILIGEAGVGKSAIIEELARCINKGCVPKKLKNSVIISLDMSSIVAGTKYRGEFEEKLNKIIETTEKNSNIILFIDEIHTISNAGGAEGAVGAGDIFKPYLARGCIKVIGATTTDEYEKYILKDKALARRFETILIKEPKLNETINILNKIKGEYEKFHNVLISKKNINDIVLLADKFIFNKKNPDKSIDFLDSVSSYVQLKNDNSKIINNYLEKLNYVKKEKDNFVLNNNYDEAILSHEKELIIEKKIDNLNKDTFKKIIYKDILKVLESKTNVPSLLNKNILKEKFNLNIKEFDKDNSLKDFFNSYINNLGSFKSLLISGNSKNIVEIFKNTLIDINFIKIDGLDFEKEESIIKLTGTYAGYSKEYYYVFKKIKNNPYSLIYIENFEYLASNIKNLFKEIKENGVIKDEKGDEISFKNVLLIAQKKIVKNNKVGFENFFKEDEKVYKEIFDEIIVNNNLKINS